MRIAVPEHGEERQRLAAAIAFLAGRLALPVAEQADRYRPERLRAYLERLEELSRSLPEGLGAGLGRLVRDDLAAIALSIGQRDGDSALLAKAGHWRLRALNEIDPVTRQVAWRQARAALGQTYFALGTAEASVRRLRSALTAMKDAVVEDDHALAPQLRASLLVDIGRVHRALGEMGDGDVSAHFLDATIAFRQAMTLARDLPEETPEQRVQRRDLSLRAQRNLANVLHILSDIERDDAMLDEAIAHYRDTLTDGARARDISGWSKAQHGLGMALNAHGARHGLAISFEQAQAAFAEALHGRNREEAPAAWAETQNQLGHAAYGLGKLKRDPREFERAIACYRAALQERTPDGDPYHWAQAQNNIGNAYQAMAQISRSEAHMEAAIKAYYKALTALDRDRNPGEWGGTQNNLGNTLHALGERREGTELLEDALRALRAALMVRTREARPLDWAATRSNMGLVHMTIGARQRSTQRLARATAAFREALEVFEAMGADHYAQMSRASLADLQSIEARLAADASR